MQEVNNKLIIIGNLEKQLEIALINNSGKLVQYINKKKANTIISNIYLARIEKVERSIESAFINIDKDLSAFISFSDIHESYFLNKKKKILEKGQYLIVQITKDANENKLASCTTYIALSGRNCIFFPKDAGNSGVSKKITGDIRKTMKEFLDTLDPNISLIIRTASTFANLSEIKTDYNKLLDLWNSIKQKAKKAKDIGLLYKEDELLKLLRGYSKQLVNEVFVSDKEVHKKILKYAETNQITFPKKIEYQKNNEFFLKEKEQINVLYNYSVPLPSGGNIIIEPTHALISIDVNSSSTKEKNMKETAFKTNKEAAEKICEQIILRNLGGLIVIDFIDMEIEEDIKILNKIIKDGFKDDKSAIKIIGYSALGIVQISRQRIGMSIFDKDFEKCEKCNGFGRKLKETEQINALIFKIKKYNDKKIKVYVTSNVLEKLLNNHSLNVKNIEWSIVNEGDKFVNTCELIALKK